MSTNFYITSSDPELEREHIGKRSAGWVFSFNGQIHKTFDDWIRNLVELEDGRMIVDEYGQHYSVEEFVEAVRATLKPYRGTTPLRNHAREAYDPDSRQKNWSDRGFTFSNYEFC
jgi:hypothetical protein